MMVPYPLLCIQLWNTLMAHLYCPDNDNSWSDDRSPVSFSDTIWLFEPSDPSFNQKSPDQG